MKRWFAWAFAVLGLLAVTPHSRADPGDALDTGGDGIASRYVLHAQAAIAQGRFTEALDYCDRAIAVYPHFIRAHFDRGRALAGAARYDLAIGEYASVIAAHPEYPLVHLFRGQANLEARNAALAIQDFNQALTADIGMGPLMAASIFAYRSLAYELSGQADAALADFERSMKAMSGDMHDYEVLNNYCYTAAVIGLLEAAKLGCDESIARHSRNEAGYDSRGLTHLKSGEWDLAIADYGRALYYRPDLAYSLYGRGIARHAKGDRAGSDADIAMAAKSEPHISEIMTRLGVRR